MSEPGPAPSAPTSGRRSRLSRYGLVLAGAAVCGVGLWLSWGVVPWILGVVLLGAGVLQLMPRTAWRWLAAGVAVVVAAVPFLLPFLSSSVPVAWSVPGERALTASTGVVLTVGGNDNDNAGIPDGSTTLRGRTAAAGEVLWEREVDAGLYEEPRAWTHTGAEVAILRVEAGLGSSLELHGIDLTTGEELWTAPAGSSTSPVATASHALVVEREGTVVVLDARTGQQQWSEPMDRLQPVRAELPETGRLPEVSYVGVRPPEEDDQPDEVIIGIHDAATGEQSGEVTVDPGVMAAVVGDQLVLDDTPALRRTDPEHPDYYRATVSGLSLPDGAEQWSVELLRPTFFAIDLDRWGIAAFGSTGISTGDGEQTYTIAPDGTLQVVSLTDGSVAQIATPPGVSFRLDTADALPTWAVDGRAVVPDARARYGGMDDAPVYAAWVDVANGQAEVVRAPASPPAATVPGDGEDGPAPLWVRDRLDPFGRTQSHALVIDDSGAEPELRDLGTMPGGAGWVHAHGDLLVAQASGKLYVLDAEGMQ